MGSQRSQPTHNPATCLAFFTSFMHSASLPWASRARARSSALLASTLTPDWRCTSCPDVAFPSVSLLISDVPGCWPFWSPAVGAGWPVVGPEPASVAASFLLTSAISCLQGPALALTVANARIAQHVKTKLDTLILSPARVGGLANCHWAYNGHMFFVFPAYAIRPKA